MDPLTTPTGAARLVDRLAEAMGSVSRRSFFVSTAVAGSALATNPKTYALRPVSAYSTICGPGSKAYNGWTVFCATINKGSNTCPPGSFAAGWWKAAGSSWCGGGYRYIVDCNATCSKCTNGCSDGICDSRCWSCSCGTGSTATCDQRRVCCNAFRYGQCNTHVSCSGGVHCRVVSCSPPYQWANCTTTSLRDDRTSEHSTPLLPSWGPITSKYHAMGDQRSYLKSSIGPIKSVGDGKGTTLAFTGGAIYDSTATPPIPLASGYVTVLKRAGGVTGPLGYPTKERVVSARGGAYVAFQRGALAHAKTKPVRAVHGPAFTWWVQAGRESGRLGYPTTDRFGGSSSWYQYFETGGIGYAGARVVEVTGAFYTRWRERGGGGGVLRLPLDAQQQWTRGTSQRFQGGQMWALTGGKPYLVTGKVLAAWREAGAGSGRYGYPVSDTRVLSDGRETGVFEGGTITV